MTLSERWNRERWRLYAPVYDWVAKPFARGRALAIDRLDLQPDDRVLLVGCGTGNDLEYFPPGVQAAAIDVTPAMVARTAARGRRLGNHVDAQIGDAHALPFEDDAFDAVLLHLVLSVVPDPGAVAAEASRVLDPDGRVSIFDKFVHEGQQPSLTRRALNPVANVLFSDLTRQLEPILAETDLYVESREWLLGDIYTVAIARHAAERR